MNERHRHSFLVGRVSTAAAVVSSCTACQNLENDSRDKPRLAGNDILTNHHRHTQRTPGPNTPVHDSPPQDRRPPFAATTEASETLKNTPRRNKRSKASLWVSNPPTWDTQGKAHRIIGHGDAITSSHNATPCHVPRAGGGSGTPHLKFIYIYNAT